MTIGAMARALPHDVPQQVGQAIDKIESSIGVIDMIRNAHGGNVARVGAAQSASELARQTARELNTAARELLGPVRGQLGDDPRISNVERALSRLTDVQWMLAQTDDYNRLVGRRDFTRLDFDGALDDSRAAVDLLRPLAPAGSAASLDDAVAKLALDLRHGTLQQLSANVAVVDTRTNAAQLVSRATWDAAQAPGPTDFARILADDLRLGNVRAVDPASEIALYDTSAGSVQLVDRANYERALEFNAAT